MSADTVIKVTMELLSDAILGSGLSIPGGEDIAVLKDAEGYPYFKGETFKGLLRESLENYLVWTGGKEDDLEAIMGKSGWNGSENHRHIHITPLTLENKPLDPDTCYSYRTFTSLENGVIKEGTLRMAAVVNRGMEFTGEIECQSCDKELLLKALSGIKYLGTMRNCGFGNVKITGTAEAKEGTKVSVNNEKNCIRLRLKTLTPLIITDLQRSNGNNLDARGYISGSAIRGAVVTALSGDNDFNNYKSDLLSEKTRFLDLIPVCYKPEDSENECDRRYVGIPSIKGFYEDKKEEDADGKKFESIVAGGKIHPEDALKRAGLGTFCAIDDKKIVYWNAEKTSSTRINRASSEKEMFQTVSLDAGQEFEGYIYTDNPVFIQKIAEVFKTDIWIGADRHSGYGKCSVEKIKTVDMPKWITEYGYSKEDKIENELYMMAISPFSMTDEYGELCGVNEEELKTSLGVNKVEIDIADTTVVEYSTYNSTWGCRDAAVAMYDRGSLFKLKCDSAPSIDKIRGIEFNGLGIRTAEGFGQILFLKPSLLKEIRGKQKAKKPEKSENQSENMKLRRARYKWIMNNVGKIGVGNNRFNQISKSQLGDIQNCCKQGIALGGDFKPVEDFLYHNMHNRGSKHGNRFKTINEFISNISKEDLSKTLGANCKNTNDEKLRLLCELFDFSRKEGE